jgi:hypothetical protein
MKRRSRRAIDFRKETVGRESVAKVRNESKRNAVGPPGTDHRADITALVYSRFIRFLMMSGSPKEIEQE